MKRIFVDTFYWLAITNPSDQWRSLVIDAVQRIDGAQLITTDEVLTEFLAGMSGLGEFHRALAVQAVRSILTDENITVVPQTHLTFTSGLDLYEARGDKGYSLTDCISMNTCRMEGITDVLTNDHHFEQEGFTILLTR